jgi:molybdopterin molybdotransferase
MVEFERREADWLSFDEALERVLARASPLDPVRVKLVDAVGLALAGAVRSTLELPPGPTSHMDGYAVSAADVLEGYRDDPDSPLEVIDASRPGSPARRSLEQGTAIRIMTGALLPDGADAVIPVEASDREKESPGRVRFRPRSEREAEEFGPGRHVRGSGEEMRSGELLGDAGDEVTAGRLALIAASGTDTVEVHPAPAVALLVTGDELVEIGDREGMAGGVRRVDILSSSLPPILRSAGARVHEPVRVGDDEAALRAAIARAAEGADLIVTTGGASMGDADLVKKALDSLDWKPDFWRIRMRPGSPVSLGRVVAPESGRSVSILGLPGNPTSATVTAILFALPAIRSMGGHRRRTLRSLRATAAEPLGGPVGLTRFLRVRLEPGGAGSWRAHLAGSQGSGALQSMAMAEGLAVVAEGTPGLDPGREVEVLLLPDSLWSGVRGEPRE